MAISQQLDADLPRAEARISLFLVAYGVFGSVGALCFGGWRAGLGFAVGTLLSFLNFEWMKAGVNALAHLTNPSHDRSPALRGAVRFLGRFVVVAVVLCAIFFSHLVIFATVLAGLFAPVAGILAEAAYETVRAVAPG